MTESSNATVFLPCWNNDGCTPGLGRCLRGDGVVHEDAEVLPVDPVSDGATLRIRLGSGLRAVQRQLLGMVGVGDEGMQV